MPAAATEDTVRLIGPPLEDDDALRSDLPAEYTSRDESPFQTAAAAAAAAAGTARRGRFCMGGWRSRCMSWLTYMVCVYVNYY